MRMELKETNKISKSSQTKKNKKKMEIKFEQ
jgi:hypothetical protein